MLPHVQPIYPKLFATLSNYVRKAPGPLNCARACAPSTVGRGPRPANNPVNIISILPSVNTLAFGKYFSGNLHGEALLFHEQKSCAASHINGFGRGHSVSSRGETNLDLKCCDAGSNPRQTSGTSIPSWWRRRTDRSRLWTNESSFGSGSEPIRVLC
jgi:hypothetical protein